MDLLWNIASAVVVGIIVFVIVFGILAIYEDRRGQSPTEAMGNVSVCAGAVAAVAFLIKYFTS